MNLKKKRDLSVLREALQARKAIKNWYCHESTKFMNKREFSNKEESMLEEITDFFLDDLDSIEQEICSIIDSDKEDDIDNK